MEDILVACEGLAAFSNLETEGDAEYFRKSAYPAFVPDAVWDSSTLTMNTAEGASSQQSQPAWIALRNHLRDVWTKKFPDDEAISLITHMFMFSAWIHHFDKVQAALQAKIRKAQELSGKRPIFEVGQPIRFEDADEPASSAPESPFDDLTPKVWPFQQAVLKMASDKWRAKDCEWCHKPFAALKPAAKYCPSREPDCFREFLKVRNREQWRKNTKKWSANKRRARAKRAKIAPGLHPPKR